MSALLVDNVRAAGLEQHEEAYSYKFNQGYMMALLFSHVPNIWHIVASRGLPANYAPRHANRHAYCGLPLYSDLGIITACKYLDTRVHPALICRTCKVEWSNDGWERVWTQ